MKVAVIIPVFDEEKTIGNCLFSLAKQTMVKDMEVIVVDDGSTDNTKSKVKSQKLEVSLLTQNHLGPGAARNRGAEKAAGEILVFLDADMEFESDFIQKLVEPIIQKKTIGTFSKEEYLLNKENIWARYWNLNLGRKVENMVPDNYPNTAPVFRAILKTEFIKAGGFDTNIGYTDDWSISKKLVVTSTAVVGAKFYHRNPETILEVWQQARWFGKNEFLTKSLVRRLFNLLRYCPLLALVRFYDPNFFVFKFVYNSAVFVSVLLSFFGEQKYK